MGQKNSSFSPTPSSPRSTLQSPEAHACDDAAAVQPHGYNLVGLLFLGAAGLYNACMVVACCLPHAFLPVYGPWLGIDINNVPNNFYSLVMIPGSLLCCWTMYECQRYVDARDMIDEQLENFSVTKTECHDEKDRPRVEREIAKWFGDGDRDVGIQKFDEYVRPRLRHRRFANALPPAGTSKRTSASSSKIW